MKVKLHPNLDKQGLKFVDPEGQRIGAKAPGKAEVLQVTDTEFVREKIRSGELILVEADAATATAARTYSEKEKKVILEEAEQGVRQLKDIIKVKGIKSELVDHVNSIIEEVESALKAKDVDRIIEAMAKAEQPMVELLDQASGKKAEK